MQRFKAKGPWEPPAENKEVKVGQVWLDRITELEVIGVSDFNSAVRVVHTGKFETHLTKSIAEMVLIKDADPELSDLEIVQKALIKVLAAIEFYAEGGWSVFSGAQLKSSGDNLESLLTWAKQTIGIEK